MKYLIGRSNSEFLLKYIFTNTNACKYYYTYCMVCMELYIDTYMCVCVCVCYHIYIFIYIYISAISKPLLSSIYECLPPLLLSDPLLLLLPSNPKFCKSPYFGFLFVMEYKT